MKIYSIHDKQFNNYGKVVDCPCFDTNEIKYKYSLVCTKKMKNFLSAYQAKVVYFNNNMVDFRY